MTATTTVSTRDRLISLAVIAVVVIGAWWLLFGRGDSGPSRPPEPRSAASYAQEFGGMTGKYEAILGISDCSTLSRMFKAGKANFEANAPGGRDVWRGQMEVTSDRMDALGCP